jgi:hypothetical protein
MIKKSPNFAIVVWACLVMASSQLFFMHFWANDDAAKLARGLRAALDQTNSKK